MDEDKNRDKGKRLPRLGNTGKVFIYHSDKFMLPKPRPATPKQ